MNKKYNIVLTEIVLLTVALCFLYFIRIRHSALVFIADVGLLVIVLRLFINLKIFAISFKNFFFIGCLILIIQQLPYLILGTNSFLIIGNNLDFFFPRIKILLDSHQLMNSGGTISSVMDGVPREGFVVNGLNIQSWLFLLFKPYYAYITNMLLINLTAYCGMFLLLKQYIIKEKEQQVLIWFISLCFGLLPFIYVIGISIAGITLLVYAVINIYHKRSSWIDFAIIAIFPFYSLIAYTGIFVIISYVIFVLYDLLKNRKFNGSLWIGFLILTIGYLITEWGLILYYLSGNIALSQRSEFTFYLFGNAQELVSGIGNNFIKGYYHCASLQGFILLCVCLLIIYKLFVRDSFFTKGIKLLIVLLLVNVCLSVLFGFYNSVYFQNIKEAFPLFRTFEFRRIFWFQPVIWYISFGILMGEIYKNGKIRFIIPLLILIKLSFQLSQKEEFLINIRLLMGKQISQPTFKEYFAEDIFSKIKTFIDKPVKSYKVVNLGIPHAVTQYNGFNTLDGYMNIYSKGYKQKFRKVIRKELDKATFLKRYFDTWGDKCYLFAAEIDEKGMFYVMKKSNFKLKNLDIVIPALKDLKCDFIFSAVEIMNAKDLKLTLLKKFNDPASAWDVYIYNL